MRNGEEESREGDFGKCVNAAFSLIVDAAFCVMFSPFAVLGWIALSLGYKPEPIGRSGQNRPEPKGERPPASPAPPPPRDWHGFDMYRSNIRPPAPPGFCYVDGQLVPMPTTAPPAQAPSRPIPPTTLTYVKGDYKATQESRHGEK